jgi:hypothetical protein
MIRFVAYVDPGTGSFALQAAVGAVMGASFVVRNHIKSFLSRFKKDSRPQKSDDAS